MSPNFINDDLPPSMRRDYAVMRQQKRKLIEDGTEIQQIKMDWSRRIVKTPFTSYKITNGLAIQEEHAEKTSFSQKQSQGQHKLSKNSRGRPWDCFSLTMDQEVVPDTQQTGSHAKTEKIPPPSPEVDKSHLNQRPKLAKTWQKLGPLIATSVANRKMYDGYEIAVKNETYTCLACGFVISGSHAFRCEPCEKDYTSYTMYR
ncbi:hypothetical protein Fcan01_22176 [Folsomia candida]|uniref:Uncharacterized protein n=1 Tax=Folsomia candida TaxID=158441 RepID=A0A226DDU6_FOLCA|nr:hypothetical protein Fcan01_22176 [Folsomia candida]